MIAFNKQFIIDLEDKIQELNRDLEAAERYHKDHDGERSAVEYGGAFSTLDPSIRFYDIPDYVEYLEGWVNTLKFQLTSDKE